MSQANRLAADAPHQFGGAGLDRGKPLQFRLDGRPVKGFAGDTVLSALLANGIFAIGTHTGVPMRLDEAFAPLVALRSDPTHPLPLQRLPAIDGLDLVTFGTAPRPQGLLSRLLRRDDDRTGSLGLLVENLPSPPWINAQPQTGLDVDTLIVGGGLAGLAAAAAAKGRTLLVERRSWLGGDARFYGTTGDEEPPEASIARLSASPSAEILLHTEVFALSGTTARAHQVLLENGRPIGRIIEISARAVVLATGTFERLPVFAGNRLPGVTGAIAAFHRAERFGVWLGKRALFSTGSGFGYRLALLAREAGVAVQRVSDTRLGPNSRFIDFCKASGVPFTSGLVPRSASLAKDLSGLSVDFLVGIEGIAQDAGTTETDQLVVGGARQPELMLWLAAGGATRWAGDHLAATGTLPGIVLAGAAAGYRRAAACIASGRAAIGGSTAPIDDPMIEAIYETPDGKTPVAPPVDGAPAFLDRGAALLRRPADPASLLPGIAIGLGAVAAAVEIGAIPPALAGQVAAERALTGGMITDTGWKLSPPPPSQQLPGYLTGRFGAKPQTCVVTSADARFFERGCLIFARSEVTDPQQAVGSIIAAMPGGGIGGLALVEREASAGKTQLFVRDAGGAVPIERIRPV
ncbi:2Fe-2S iron-sulfur cluster-binding protein [Devosia sp.]|jgi:sarcosine oxidase subunit alpha|uniref:2Fe-2S iron-sulfur cluster-binding protein n=1 Tax=Devosia sp. TaxID=1871048 RepID=UPI0037C0E1EC